MQSPQKMKNLFSKLEKMQPHPQQKSQNPLKKLSKLEMLELLAQQERELQALRAALKEKEEALAERQIQIEQAGSIAEAALKLNEVFEAAQRAADQYLESVKSQHQAEDPENEVWNKRKKGRKSK